MQSFLAKCVALGIVAGGFTLTGDVGRVAERGRRLLDARTVPSETPAEPMTDGDNAAARGIDSRHAATPAPPEAPQPPAPPLAQPTTATQPVVAAAARAMPSVRLPDAPIGRPVAMPTPPANGPDWIDLRRVPAGSRVLVWVRRSGTAGRARAMDLIALDLIDPKSGEALEHRHAAMTHGSEGTTVHAAPRRVVITRDATGRIAKGGLLQLAPLHGVSGLGPEEAIGTVLAIDVPVR